MIRSGNIVKRNIRITQYDFAVILPWVIGLLVGFWFAYTFKGFFTSLMHMAVVCPVSIVASVACVLFPYLISVYFFLHHRRLLLYFVCFIKAACYAFSFATLSVIFGSAGWLICALFLFSDTYVCILILNLCLCVRQRMDIPGSVLLQTTICLVVILIDSLYISPFLCGLF